MVFKKWNIIYPSKKVYNDLKIIEKILNLFIKQHLILALIIS